jgi:hypothetical protein
LVGSLLFLVDGWLEGTVHDSFLGSVWLVVWFCLIDSWLEGTVPDCFLGSFWFEV